MHYSRGRKRDAEERRVARGRVRGRRGWRLRGRRSRSYRMVYHATPMRGCGPPRVERARARARNRARWWMKRKGSLVAEGAEGICDENKSELEGVSGRTRWRTARDGRTASVIEVERRYGVQSGGERWNRDARRLAGVHARPDREGGSDRGLRARERTEISRATESREVVVNGGGRLPHRASAKASRGGGTARRCSQMKISPALVAGEAASGKLPNGR